MILEYSGYSHSPRPVEIIGDKVNIVRVYIDKVNIDKKLHYYIYKQTMLSILKNKLKVILKKLFLSSFPNSCCLTEERMSLFGNKNKYLTQL